MKMAITKIFEGTYRVFFLLLCLSASNFAFSDDIKIGSLVVNKTITWFGQDFYHYFSSEWRNQRNIRNQRLVIEEVPSARKGTQIIIRYKETIVFQASIAGTRSSSREKGSEAVSIVLSRMQNIDISSGGYQQADLGKDEI
jgi:curli production assembly/transport component CsgE